jgi:hypothetical protein
MEVPDPKNGATEKTETIGKEDLFFSVLFVGSIAPFLRSVASFYLFRLEAQSPKPLATQAL